MTATALHQILPVNTKGRDLVVGDIHGMTAMLHSVLTRARFNPARDRVISVGDLIDRGSDSLGALALLDQPWFFAVRGNHEAMLMEVAATGNRTLWYAAGGEWGRDADLSAIARRLKNLPIALTIPRPDGRSFGICHAEYPLDDWADIGIALNEPQIANTMLWGRKRMHDGQPVRTLNITATIHGHTPISESLALGNALFIDTGAVYGGTLTVVDVDMLPDLKEAAV